ncbi:unnamed protein product [Ceutorhynchus assimilis]|uniref:Uncharacterized protein n=1 Tax=Ceutorhynchus assimilis TaxID=467358 RepID=A0A9N9MN52_9CUCU|nr:unnamed protein product [Ceutorhynchus assimilis]
MLFACCGRRNRQNNDNWTDLTNKQGNPPNSSHQTPNTIVPAHHPVQRVRSTSGSSFSSLRSAQSFYSVKSGADGDFYSICSDSSFKELP